MNLEEFVSEEWDGGKEGEFIDPSKLMEGAAVIPAVLNEEARDEKQALEDLERLEDEGTEGGEKKSEWEKQAMVCEALGVDPPPFIGLVRPLSKRERKRVQQGEVITKPRFTAWRDEEVYGEWIDKVAKRVREVEATNPERQKRKRGRPPKKKADIEEPRTLKEFYKFIGKKPPTPEQVAERARKTKEQLDALTLEMFGEHGETIEAFEARKKRGKEGEKQMFASRGFVWRDENLSREAIKHSIRADNRVAIASFYRAHENKKQVWNMDDLPEYHWQRIQLEREIEAERRVRILENQNLEQFRALERDAIKQSFIKEAKAAQDHKRYERKKAKKAATK